NFRAGPGYDLVTGRGTPVANLVVADLVGTSATTVALGSSVNPAGTGQAVTFTATVAAVAPVAGTPTGTVTFKDGDVILRTVAVGSGGAATFTTSFAAAGSHAITAVYSGDNNFAASSQTITEQVNAAGGIAIDSGGGAAGTFAADTDVTGGSTF